MSEKDINNLKEMLVYFNEYSTDYTKTRCRELEETIKNTLKEIERLNNIINEINSIVEYWGYDKEHNDISSFRMAMKNIKDVLGSDK